MPESIEDLHGEVTRMVSAGANRPDLILALLALLTLHPGATDEAVQAVLDHRCVATVMGS